MSRTIYYISELYDDAMCPCGSKCIKQYMQYVTIPNNPEVYSCCKCIHPDVKYPKMYIYYEGINGYITLYGDTEESLKMEYGSSHNGRLALYNLLMAKMKHKL